MAHVDGPIIIQPDKVERRPPCAWRNPEKLLAVYVPSARRRVLNGDIDPAVNDGIEAVLVIKIINLPSRCLVVAADRQHALHRDFTKRHVMRQTDLRVWL